MRTDYQAYLPGETMHINVAIKNPTDSPLRVLSPFQRGSGSFYITRVFQNGADEPPLWSDDTYYPARFDGPTMIMQPGQEVEKTVETERGRGDFRVPAQFGPHRVKYGYDLRSGADFRVIDVSQAKLLALNLLHLEPEQTVDEKNRPITRRPFVAFFAVETAPGEYWLFRSNPDLRTDPTPFPKPEFTVRKLLDQLAGFERVGRLEEPARSLQLILRGDETVDVIATMSSGWEHTFHIPARPTKPQ